MNIQIARRLGDAHTAFPDQANRLDRHLFLAQVVALAGSGLLTVALVLLAYQIAGANAGAVLGTALAIKMIAYVGVAPVAAAFADRWPRRMMLVALDLVRAAIALVLPFISETWHIYALIFVLQSASAAFTPTFPATIPDILPDEQDYTNALSLSRLAYDLETLLSPVLAAALLTLISYHGLFMGTVIGFISSALLVVSVNLPKPLLEVERGMFDRTTRGIRIYLATPRLRGLLAVSFAVAAVGALVIVNTVIFVQTALGLIERATAAALAAFGGGSMVAAFALPRLLDRIPDRHVMAGGAFLLVTGAVFAAFVPHYTALLFIWFIIGIGYSTAQTPSGRLLRRSSHPEDRPALFAAQFALSHACWLLTYPLAGWLGAMHGLQLAALAMAAIASAGLAAALYVWPAHDPAEIEHEHAEINSRPLKEHVHHGAAQKPGVDHRHLPLQHSHAYIIDDNHPIWPDQKGRLDRRA